MHIVYVNVVSRDESINDAKPDFLAVYLSFSSFRRSLIFHSLDVICSIRTFAGNFKGSKLVFFIVESQHKNR